MIFGKGFYAVPDLDGKAKPEMIVKPLGSAGTADPLDQRASVGWKAFFTTARLNELCGIRLESGATI
jgi:N4-gp56 family major capsid protein